MSAQGNADVLRVRAEGELTIYAVSRQKEEWLPQLARTRALELALGAVTELDGAGLQLLVHLKREAQRTGCALRLVDHSPAVIEALDLCGLGAFFGDPLVIPSDAMQGARP